MSNQIVIVFGGDSIAAMTDHTSWTYQSVGVISRGAGVDPDASKSYFYTNSANSILMMNMAVAATRLNTNGFPDLIPLAPGYIDPVVAQKAVTIGAGTKTRKYVFVNCIGTNDGAIGTQGNPTDYALAVAAASVARKTAGFDLCGMQTLLPRNDGVMSELNRTAYNAFLTDSSWRATNGIDYVLDLASETTMGNPATCSNTTYYADGVHPTLAGHALLAPIAASLWSTILATF